MKNILDIISDNDRVLSTNCSLIEMEHNDKFYLRFTNPFQTFIGCSLGVSPSVNIEIQPGVHNLYVHPLTHKSFKYVNQNGSKNILSITCEFFLPKQNKKIKIIKDDDMNNPYLISKARVFVDLEQPKCVDHNIISGSDTSATTLFVTNNHYSSDSIIFKKETINIIEKSIIVDPL
jgi:hypothetical protein